MKKKKVMISGGFDPVHAGHVSLIRYAAKLGKVIVVVNSDAWLRRKKGYRFMPWSERVEIMEAFKGVTGVCGVDDVDGTVCEAIRRMKPDIFANGGDRTSENTPEMILCEEMGIEMAWGIGGGKVQSSSELVAHAGMHIPLRSNGHRGDTW